MSSSGQSYTSSSASSDVTPLLGNSNTNSDSGGNFYFLQQSNAGGASHGSNRSAATNEFVEKLPYGATEDEFASRPIVVSDHFDSLDCIEICVKCARFLFAPFFC